MQTSLFSPPVYLTPLIFAALVEPDALRFLRPHPPKFDQQNHWTVSYFSLSLNTQESQYGRASQGIF